MVKSAPQLPGLSRSAACSQRSCRRLAGHNGEHRSTLTSSVKAVRQPAVVAPKVIFDDTVTVGGETWHITVDAEGNAKSVKVPATAKAGKAARVRKVAYVAPKARIGVSGVVGQHRTARRAKAAPQGTKSRNNAGAVRLPVAK